MVDIALIEIIYLLFFGMIGTAIINIALLIIICVFLHRQ